jgi:hypothetical protein
VEVAHAADALGQRSLHCDEAEWRRRLCDELGRILRLGRPGKVPRRRVALGDARASNKGPLERLVPIVPRSAGGRALGGRGKRCRSLDSGVRPEPMP